MLSDEQIENLNDISMDRLDYEIFEIDQGSVKEFARAIEAEVRKQDDALIRQMLDALEYAYRPLCMCFAGCDNCDPTKEIPDAQAAITAARARLSERRYAS